MKMQSSKRLFVVLVGILLGSSNLSLANHHLNLEDYQLIVSQKNWRFGISRHLFRRKIPLLQHRKYEHLIGNFSSTLKVMPSGQTFSSQKTLKDQCDFLKEVYMGVEVAETTFSVEYQTAPSAKKFPHCWIIKENSLGQQIQVIMFTPREGKTKDFSYMFHNFTFNFPKTISKQAVHELKQLFQGDIKRRKS